MNPLIQLKKATPLFVIALVLACFTLSPQAFAQQVEMPTFTAIRNENCRRWELRISSATPDPVTIDVWGFGGGAYMRIANNARIPYRSEGTLILAAQAHRSGWTDSPVAYCYNQTRSRRCR